MATRRPWGQHKSETQSQDEDKIKRLYNKNKENNKKKSTTWYTYSILVDTMKIIKLKKNKWIKILIEKLLKKNQHKKKN